MAGMRQLFAWRSSNNVSTGTVYNCLTSGLAWTGTIAQATAPWCIPGYFQYLRVRLASAPGAGKFVRFMVMKNGVDTHLTCTISGTATEGYSLGSRITVADGDTLVLKAIGGNTPTVSVADVSIDFFSSADYLSGHAVAAVGTSFANSNRSTALFNGAEGWVSSGLYSVNAVEGDITQLRLLLGTAPSSTHTIIYVIEKNGVVQDGTGGTVDTRITISGLSTTGTVSFTLPVSPADTLTLRQFGGTGSPLSGEVRWAIKFAADVNGQFNLGGQTQETIGTATTQVYNAIGTGGRLASNATESARDTRNSGREFTLQALYLNSGNVVNGSGVAVKVRVNAADSALAVTHINATHSVVTDVDVPSVAGLSMSFLGLGGGGFSRSFGYGLRAYIDPTTPTRQTPSIVQSAWTDATGQPAATNSVSLTGVVAGNHLLLVLARWNYGAGAGALTGQATDGANKWGEIITATGGGGTTCTGMISKVTTGGSVTVTWDPDAASEYNPLGLIELADVDPDEPIWDGVQGNYGGSATIDIADLITDCLLIGVASGTSGGLTQTPGAGFTQTHVYNYANSVLQGYAIEHKSASAGVEDILWTFGGGAAAVIGFAIQGEIGSSDNEGEIDVTAPAAQFEMLGGQGLEATIDGTAPAAEGEFFGTESNNGVTDVTAPAAQFEMLGGPAGQASFDVTAPSAEAEFIGGPPIEAEFDGTVSPAAAIFYGGQEVTSEIDATTPAAQFEALAGQIIIGVIDVTAPAATFLMTSGDGIFADIEVQAPKATFSMIGYTGAGITAVMDVTAPKATFRMIGPGQPVDLITLTKNGVNINSNWYMPSKWKVAKRGSSERMTFTTVDPIESEDAFRIEENDIVLMIHPVGGLIFGGFVKEVEDARIKSEAGVLNLVTAVDWMFHAKQIFVPKQKMPAGRDWFALFAELVTNIFAARGWINIGPSTGGAILPEIVVDDSLSDYGKFFDRMKELTEQPVRINGQLEAAVIEEGTLIWPGGEINGSNAKLVPDVKWSKESFEKANRLWAKTTAPRSGKGPFYHEETHYANGVQTVFPTNVIPGQVEGQLALKAVAGVTSLSLKELPVGGRIRVGNKFYLSNDPREYMCTTDAVVDADGNATISCETIELEAGEGTTVTFDPPAFTVLKISGVDTPFAGDPWVYEPLTVAWINPSVAPAFGTAITVGMWLNHPAEIRVWETSTPVPQLEIGWFDFSILVDGKMDEEEFYDLPYAADVMRAKLQTRPEGQQLIKFTTHEHGLYPYLAFDANFPKRLIFGRYFVETVDVEPNGADPRLTDKDLTYVVTARKNIVGKNPWDYYRGRSSNLAMGEPDRALPADFQWTTNREYVFPGESDGIELNPTPDWEFTPWKEVTLYAFAALVFTAIIIEETDAEQPYYAWSRHFEVQLGVGEPGEEVVIANFKGHSKEDHHSVTEAGMMRLMYPVDACPEGSKVWIRMRYSPGGWLSIVGPWKIAIQAYAKPLVGNLATTPYVQEHTDATQDATEITVAAVAGDWSPWVTLMDESEYDMLLTGRIFSVASFNDLIQAHVQFAVHDPGDSPTEDDVVKNEAFSEKEVALGNTNWVAWENPYFLNSGLRVSARIKTQVETGGGPRCSLTYVRFVE